MIYLIVTLCMLSTDRCETARIQFDGNQLACVMNAESVIAQLSNLDEWQGYQVMGWRCERGMPI